jgi:hypothetical protein
VASAFDRDIHRIEILTPKHLVKAVAGAEREGA